MALLQPDDNSAVRNLGSRPLRHPIEGHRSRLHDEVYPPGILSLIVRLFRQAHDSLRGQPHRIGRQDAAFDRDHFNPLNVIAVKTLQKISFSGFRHTNTAHQPRARGMDHVLSSREPDRAQQIVIVANGIR
jgi:hypothetical protein